MRKIKFNDYIEERGDMRMSTLFSIGRIATLAIALTYEMDEVAVTAISFAIILDSINLLSKFIKFYKGFVEFNRNIKREEEKRERILKENSEKNSQNWNSFFKKGGEL